MSPPRPSRGIHGHGEEQRTVWGQLWRYVLAPPFYWLDLLDNERRPSHSKVTWTIAFAAALVILFGAAALILHDHDAPTPTELSFLLAFAALTFGLAGGLDGFKTWAKTKGGGTSEAFAESVKAALDHPGKAFEEDAPDG